jgi:hypothetical protein
MTKTLTVTAATWEAVYDVLLFRGEVFELEPSDFDDLSEDFVVGLTLPDIGRVELQLGSWKFVNVCGPPPSRN